MGLAFERLLPGQEHRRVVPLVQAKDKVCIAPCGLVEHCDTKYSLDLEAKLGSVLDVTEMFGYA